MEQLVLTGIINLYYYIKHYTCISLVKAPPSWTAYSYYYKGHKRSNWSYLLH
jgi:hypothetical protein